MAPRGKNSHRVATKQYVKSRWIDKWYHDPSHDATYCQYPLRLYLMRTFRALPVATGEHASNTPHSGRSWLSPAFMLLVLLGLQVPANGAGTVQFGNGKVIDADAYKAYFMFSEDLDGDGDEDLLSLSFHGDFVRRYMNEDGKGTFSEAVDISADSNGAE